MGAALHGLGGVGVAQPVGRHPGPEPGPSGGGLDEALGRTVRWPPVRERNTGASGVVSPVAPRAWRSAHTVDGSRTERVLPPLPKTASWPLSPRDCRSRQRSATNSDTRRPQAEISRSSVRLRGASARASRREVAAATLAPYRARVAEVARAQTPEARAAAGRRHRPPGRGRPEHPPVPRRHPLLAHGPLRRPRRRRSGDAPAPAAARDRLGPRPAADRHRPCGSSSHSLGRPALVMPGSFEHEGRTAVARAADAPPAGAHHPFLSRSASTATVCLCHVIWRTRPSHGIVCWLNEAVSRCVTGADDARSSPDTGGSIG
jgi:hypothetical protein